MGGEPKKKVVVQMNDVDVEDDDDKNKKDKGYSWEEEYKRSWDVIQEDEQGSLQSLVSTLNLQLKRRRQQRDTEIVKRGIIRHLFIIIDLSASMADKDLRPSRINLTIALLESFIMEYFDQNPISQLGIIVTRNGMAEKISELSGNTMDHISQLKLKSNHEVGGEPSLQNALELALSSLRHVPKHGSREVLGIFGSLSTCDPGDIYQTIDNLNQFNIRCSMIGLSAEVYVFKQASLKTQGTYNVVFNESHYKNLLFEMTPPPALASDEATKTSLVLMGFPKKLAQSDISLCVCHFESRLGGYECPRCMAKSCEIPTQCQQCQLTLISSPHLARSYHHLFPISRFKELDPSKIVQKKCIGCNIKFQLNNTSNQFEHYQCQKCLSELCIDCDIFIHDSLHNCPGCTKL